MRSEPMPATCPICGSEHFQIDRSPQQIEAETNLRSVFVTHRLGHPPHGPEAADLTRFTHGNPARLLACRQCGMLYREENDPISYEKDRCDFDLMNHLYPRILNRYRAKESLYRPLFREHAEILEVGSFSGAFLETAEEWGWRPIGLDIGHSTNAFARARGAIVRQTAIEDYSPRLRRPEGIFIWNCFEQLHDPGSALRRSHRLLDRHGLLLLRVPNADFYRRQRERLQQSRSALWSLGYNNLLGYPYLHGYTRSLLARLLARNGFAPLNCYPTNVHTPPYPDLNPRIRAEWQRTLHYGDPWIEVMARRAED